MPNIPVKSLEEFLDREVDGQFAIPDRVLERWGRLFDIVTPSSKNTCCFTRGILMLPARLVLIQAMRLYPSDRGVWIYSADQQGSDSEIGPSIISSIVPINAG